MRKENGYRTFREIGVYEFVHLGKIANTTPNGRKVNVFPRQHISNRLKARN